MHFFIKNSVNIFFIIGQKNEMWYVPRFDVLCVFGFLKCDTYLDFVKKLKIMKRYLDFSEKYFGIFFWKTAEMDKIFTQFLTFWNVIRT